MAYGQGIDSPGQVAILFRSSIFSQNKYFVNKSVFILLQANNFSSVLKRVSQKQHYLELYKAEIYVSYLSLNITALQNNIV